MKQNVYMSQVNSTYGRNAFLPYSVGLLQAYALTDPVIRDNYSFKGFFYFREPIDQALSRMENPSVFAASCYIWNSKYTHALARAVKQAYPKCLIVLGGPHVPVRSDTFFQRHPWADLLIHYEGEVTFADVLKRYASYRIYRPRALVWIFNDISGLSVNDFGQTRKTPDRPRLSDLDVIPSPYLTGIFDELLADKRYDWHATQETHRGCPYSCTFCIAAGTRIATIEGDKPIESIASTDMILGWDDGRLVWSKADCSVFSGNKPILRIHAGDCNAEATGDHPFCTKRGWIKAADLVIGDEVLSRVREVHRRNAEACEILLPAMLANVAAEESDYQSCSQERPLQGELCGQCREDASGQSNEAARSGHEASDYADAKGDSGHVRSVSQHGQRPKANCQDCAEEGAKSGQSDEKSGNCQAARKNKQAAQFKANLGADEGRESDAQCQVANQSEKCLGRSGCARKVPDEVASIAQKSAKQFREETNSLPGSARDPVSLCGRCFVLDRSQESGLHSRDQEENHLGSRIVLAPGQGESSEGEIDLQKCRLAGVNRLGIGETDRFIGQENQGVRWQKITHIEPAGVAKVYDIINARPAHNFFANGLLVSNCDWGSNTLAKLKKFSTERLLAEIEFFAKHQIDLLYNADANYGIFERDLDLTQKMADIKARTGYPRKFRAAYAKNSNETVYKIATILNNAGMNKGITLSFQSMDDHTLEVVKRKNIRVQDFSNLMQRYRREGIATYSEIIIGLPGETYDSFANGLDTLLNCGQHDSIQCYNCEVLPNAEMNKPEYREQHGIKTVHTPVLFFHGTPATDPHHEEYELIIETAMLPTDDWLRCHRLAWAVQCFHCLSLTQCIAVFAKHHGGIPYRTFYESLLRFADQSPGTILGQVTAEVTDLFRGIREGNGWGIVDQRFGNIMWPPEEGGFLKCVVDKERFYSEIFPFAESVLDAPRDVLIDLFIYQRRAVKSPASPAPSAVMYDIDGFLKAAYRNEAEILAKHEARVCGVKNPARYSDLETYAREVVWYGRKGGRFQHEIEVMA